MVTLLSLLPPQQFWVGGVTLQHRQGQPQHKHYHLAPSIQFEISEPPVLDQVLQFHHRIVPTFD